MLDLYAAGAFFNANTLHAERDLALQGGSLANSGGGTLANSLGVIQSDGGDCVWLYGGDARLANTVVSPGYGAFIQSGGTVSIDAGTLNTSEAPATAASSAPAAT